MQGRLIKTGIMLAGVLLCCWLCSCRKQQERFSARDYVRHVEDRSNGFIKEKQIGSLRYRLKYTPAAYQAAHKIIGGEIKNQEQLDSYMKARGGLSYFVLEIENTRSESDVLLEGIHDQGSYLQRVNYFSFDFERDIRLVPGSDTLQCALFHYENSYGGTPKLRFLIAFEDKGGKKERTLVVNDKVFNNGVIKFELEPGLWQDPGDKTLDIRP